MAKTTDANLRNMVIYSVYVRNHTKEGTFKALESDLDRIKALGTDMIWLMPIHPIGVEGKKGSLGCPYANRDYRSVNPAYGTMEEFLHLVDEIHKKDMKCMIDVVYNHTSPDSVLAKEHPEYFYKTEDGKMGNKVGDWGDVVDLDYTNKALWDYQIESLKMWASIVDGFRCDVASLVPVEFWMQAREAVAQINPDCIWLAESIDKGFLTYVRSLGIPAWSDGELYQAFDMEYDYEIRHSFNDYLDGNKSLHEYIDMLNFEECMYPENYIKMRCLENHDQPRIKSRVSDEKALINWTAFLYFQKGSTLIYAGQETEDDHLPSLFEIDPANFHTGQDLRWLLTRLYEIKKRVLLEPCNFQATADDAMDMVTAIRIQGNHKIVGIFSLKAKVGRVNVPLEDGEYINLISKEKTMVKKGTVECNGMPMILV